MLSAFLIASLLGSVANAVTSTYTNQVCFTTYTTAQMMNAPTAYGTSTTTLPAVTTFTTLYPTATITGPPGTTTSTTFSLSTVKTTVTPSTNSYTITRTTTTITTTTSTSVATVSATTTSTTTLAATTSTIAPSAGFTPIQSYIAAQGYAPARAKRELEQRGASLRAPAGATKYSVTGAVGARATQAPAAYNSQVSCVNIIEIQSTITGTIVAPTSTVTVAPTSSSTVTSTSTVYVTSTIVATQVAQTYLTSTSTISLTSTAVATTSTTTTVTSTVSSTPPPLATVYAACQNTANFLTSVNGNSIVAIADQYGMPGVAAASAYDCCVRCEMAGSACAGSAFINNGNLQYCFLAPTNGGTCAAGTGIPVFEADTKQTTPYYILSNSDCGQWIYSANIE